MTKIVERCWACTEPIFEDEKVHWVIPRGREFEEPHHGECCPTEIFVEENDVYPLSER